MQRQGAFRPLATLTPEDIFTNVNVINFTLAQISRGSRRRGQRPLCGQQGYGLQWWSRKRRRCFGVPLALRQGMAYGRDMTDLTPVKLTFSEDQAEAFDRVAGLDGQLAARQCEPGLAALGVGGLGAVGGAVVGVALALVLEAGELAPAVARTVLDGATSGDGYL